MLFRSATMSTTAIAHSATRSLDQVFDFDDSDDSNSSPPMLSSAAAPLEPERAPTPALSGTSTPLAKRKSLLEQIDEDHPGSRSERARPRRSLPTSSSFSQLVLQSSAESTPVPMPKMLRAKSTPRVHFSFFKDENTQIAAAPVPAIDLNSEDGEEGKDLGWRWLRETQDAASQALKRGQSAIWTPPVLADAMDESVYDGASEFEDGVLHLPAEGGSIADLSQDGLSDADTIAQGDLQAQYSQQLAPSQSGMRTRRRTSGSPTVRFDPRLPHEDALAPQLQPAPASSYAAQQLPYMPYEMQSAATSPLLAHQLSPTPHEEQEIGRASCRERV